jgi:hypothetical protein
MLVGRTRKVPAYKHGEAYDALRGKGAGIKSYRYCHSVLSYVQSIIQLPEQDSESLDDIQYSGDNSADDSVDDSADYNTDNYWLFLCRRFRDASRIHRSPIKSCVTGRHR